MRVLWVRAGRRVTRGVVCRAGGRGFESRRSRPSHLGHAALAPLGCCCGEAPGRCTVRVGPRILAGVATIAHWDDLERERAEVGPLCSYWTDLSTPAGSKTVRLNGIEVDPA